MKKLLFLLSLFTLFNCAKSEPAKEVALPTTYYFVATMYTYPELLTVKRSSIEYDRTYKQQGGLQTSDINTLQGNLTEEGYYRVSDQWEEYVTKIIKQKNDLFKIEAPIYWIDITN